MLGENILISDKNETIESLGEISTLLITDYLFGVKVGNEIAERFDAGILCNLVEKPKLKRRV